VFDRAVDVIYFFSELLFFLGERTQQLLNLFFPFDQFEHSLENRKELRLFDYNNMAFGVFNLFGLTLKKEIVPQYPGIPGTIFP